MIKLCRVLLLLFTIAFLVPACSNEQGINKGKFLKIDQAVREARGSLDTGASYQQFSELLQRLSAEIGSLESKVSSKEERDLLDAYSDLLSFYQDGLLLWKYKLDFAPFNFVPKGRIYVGQDVEPIVSKYRFPVESQIYQPTGQRWKSMSDDSIRIIWSTVDTQLKIIENMKNY
jgi:hypothetical protein